MNGEERLLYIDLAPDGSLKIGTCEHCVVQEAGRPTRAWDPQGDAELDFDRDGLLATLASLGVQAEVHQQYVCP
jgi:hypothetical protein